MVFRAMGVSWNNYRFQLSCSVVLILVLDIQGCWSLTSEGLALLGFRARVDYDPYGTFANWNPNDSDPCMWSGVHCVDDKVRILQLSGLSLEGKLAPEIGKLSHLTSLALWNNHFSGVIPKEIGGLSMLEVLDLRNNNLSGVIPAELGGLQSLRHLLLSNNNFEGSIPPEVRKLNKLSEFQFNEKLTCTLASGIGCINRKFGQCIWQCSLKQLRKANSFVIPLKATLLHHLNMLTLFKSGKHSSYNPEYNCCNNLPSANEMQMVQNVENLVVARRRLLQQSSNLAAAPAHGGSAPEQTIAFPTAWSSGSFPAVPNAKNGHPPVSSPAGPSSHQNHHTSDTNSQSSASKHTDENPASAGTSGRMWKYIVVISGFVFLLTVAASVFFMCRSQAVSAIGPWKTGLSGQLQKAFLTGVPKLNQAELESACEDFSNIIDTIDGCTVYKGTLSNGVEIAVASTAISSAKNWSKHSELIYRKQIGTLSRINHKNFVNLIGYCEEDETFTRMMVFEYAPNGSLFEHLHVKDVEPLDWGARMRIIMGTAYCLKYMHYQNPAMAHSNLNSSAVFLTDDYAAKIAEIGFWAESSSKSKNSGENGLLHFELPLISDPETNVYSFGVLLLEIISGKLPYSEEQGPLVNWAAEYLNDKERISYIIDPALKSFNDAELDIICEVIRDCIHKEASKRPTMGEITSRLREVIAITPDAATPRVSPLWWAELEILHVEEA
ncbi:protein MALE DISCOVERER 2-like isoform X2 [Diospyros lotus]|uniref:protein MALE DISCOVERER 2-like isoform X2 n=1 Tax=Diospyros lotus TaxID=55363 RepID=UPI002251D1E0|nr:protein MALE DISCOVERER 2-like isoform X2 [Diospyros lotus]